MYRYSISTNSTHHGLTKCCETALYVLEYFVLLVRYELNVESYVCDLLFEKFVEERKLKTARYLKPQSSFPKVEKSN